MIRTFFLLLSFGTFMHAQEPFSFTEISSLAVDLQQPQFLKASDGINLAFYSFLNPSHNDITLLYAGGGLYGNQTYQWVAKTLQEQYGIGCYIFDIRGHGHSGGSRGDAPSKERVWLDVKEAISFIKSKNPSANIYLVGHSSGAGLIINYAAHTRNHKKQESGYIFIAPFLGPKSDTARNLKDHASFIKKVRTWVYIAGALFPHSFFTHYKALFFNYPKAIFKKDPLILSFYTYAMSCATTPYEINALLPAINKPTALFIGAEDEQFVPEKVIAYTSQINASVTTHRVERVGHLSILLEAPKLIAEYIKSQSMQS